MPTHIAYLGIGSNIDPDMNIPKGLDALSAAFGAIQISSIYQSEAIGFSGPPFLNLAVQINTEFPLDQLAKFLREIEFQFGRTVNSQKFSSRSLDIDLLTYANYDGIVAGIELPRPEIFFNAHVLRPFSEIAPDLLLPGQSLALAELWQRFDKTQQRIFKVNIQSQKAIA